MFSNGEVSSGGIMGLESLAKPTMTTWYNIEKDYHIFRVEIAGVMSEINISSETLATKDKSYIKVLFHMKFYELEQKWPALGKMIDNIIDNHDKSQGVPVVNKAKKPLYSKGGIIKKGPTITGGNYLGELPEVKMLPGLMQKVKHPITGHVTYLRDIIISLNDGSQWTREQIADWLDTLDVDLRFKTPEDKQLTLEETNG